MTNEKGIAPLLIPLIIAIVGVTGVTTYTATNGFKESPFATLSQSPKNNQRLENKESSKKLECPKPNTWVYTVTENKINEYLKNKYEYKGYKLESGNVSLGNNSASANLNLNDNRGLYIKVSLNEKGNDFRVDELSSTGANKISKTELAAIKILLDNADKVIWAYTPDNYKEMFKNVSITENNKVEVFFYTQEYLDCISN